MPSLLDAATAWLAHDPDSNTRQELQAMIDSDDTEALASCFGTRLQFGTAGMRGKMGPGPGRMNRALVRQVTAGLGHFLLSSLGPEAAKNGVAVAFDGRKNSRAFAEDAAVVLATMGIVVHCFEDTVATPRLAHALTHLNAAAGIMVTASHNPPADNGYKVYWSNGAQIISPVDKGISAAIDAIQTPADVAMGDAAALRRAGLIRSVPDSVWDAYLSAVLNLRVHTGSNVRAVYTALHGVGYADLARLLDAAGHAPLLAVKEQRDPDGDFPTVSFPNPEEPGAMDLALALAQAQNADIVLANDPDADRLSVAIPDGQGQWRQLTGNEVGVLLMDDLLTHGAQSPDRFVVTTVVSTALAATVAAAHQAQVIETLTGFKWIANQAMSTEGEFVLGFEESLGYSAGTVVRDKDGLSAALLMLDLLAHCKAKGLTLMDHLEVLWRRHGYALSDQQSVRFAGSDGPAQMAAIMQRLRDNPPQSIGGLMVQQRRDALNNTVEDTTTGKTRTLGLPSSNLLAFDLEQNCRVLARPSGTEPKIKFYFEVCMTPEDAESIQETAARAQTQLDKLKTELQAYAL